MLVVQMLVLGWRGILIKSWGFSMVKKIALMVVVLVAAGLLAVNVGSVSSLSLNEAAPFPENM